MERHSLRPCGDLLRVSRHSQNDFLRLFILVPRSNTLGHLIAKSSFQMRKTEGLLSHFSP